MKIGKKLLSLLLIAVLLVGIVPVGAVAEMTPPVTAETGELGIEGTNSFGNLISDAVTDYEAEQSDEEYSGNYSVTALEVSGNIATVTYDALESATLVVAVYSEDGMQLVTSGKATVNPAETQAEVTIEGAMPEFFEVSAYLLDEQDLSPLCAAYSSPMYTRQMQQLLNSTIHDYDPELVLNLDADENTNFAVYNPQVVTIEPVEDVNKVVSVDLENNIYVIENADEQITTLAAGTIFTYAYQNGEILIVKVESVSVTGTTATITGTETDIGEVFDCLKLETAGNTGDVIVDDSEIAEGITYEGLVEEESKPATRAWEDDVTLKKKSLSFKISINVEEEGSGSVGASLAGDFKLTAYPKLEFYISMKRQHIEVTADLVGNLDASFQGTMKQEGLKLGKVTFPSPVGGITFSGEPKLVVQFNMTAQLSTVMSMTVGFGYDSSDGVLNLCTKPEIDMENSMEGSLFFGIEFEASAEVISKNIASVGFTITGGVRITGKMTGTNHEPPPKENATKKHTCEDCLSLRFDRVREFSVWAKLIKYIKIEKTLKSETNHMFDMYWSLVSDHPSTGFGRCPNYVYRVTVKVQDKAGNVVEGQEVFLKNGRSLGKTGDKGTLVAYLETGNYVFQTTIGEEIIEVTRKVSSATRVVLTNNPKILQELAALEKLLMGSIEIKTHDTYLIGTFSSGVTWKLYRSGQLVVEGEGAMDYYSSFSKVPWCNYSDKIKEVEIKEGVTNVGSYAFSGCTNLEKVVLGNSVKSIGNYAFIRCSGLLEIRLPVDYAYQAYSFDGCNNVQKIQYTCGEENVVMPDRYDSSRYSYYVRNSLEFICGDALKTVIFDEGITNVGNYAFFGAEGLENVYLAESITKIGSDSFHYSGIKKLVLPEYLTSIGSQAFWNSDIEEIHFPDSLKTIGSEAFAYCYDLTEVVIPNSAGAGLCTSAFLNCTALKSVTVPVDYELYAYGVFEECRNVESIHYTPGASGVMTDRNSYSVSGYADDYKDTLEYACRSSLKTITFDEGITHIANYAYSGSSALEYVELPSTLQSIGWSAFYDTGLDNIELPEGLTTIGYSAFESSDLLEIRFPDSLKTIGHEAFAYCYGLTELVIPDHLSNGLSSSAFLYCSGLRKVTLPVDYELSSQGIFKECRNVESIHYTPGASGVMTDRNSYSVSGYADDYKNTLEYACRSSLKTITFDEGITHIGTYAFYGSKLTSITFTGNAPVVAYNAFSNVTATAYYPSGNTTWTADKLQNFGGNLTWVAMEMPVTVELIYEKTPEKTVAVKESVSTAQSDSKEQTVAQTTEKPAQRSIFAGEYSAVELDDRIVHTARFSGLVAGEEYVMIAVLEVDTEDLLADSNLLAIRQGVAEEDGTLVFDYVQRVQADVSYVFAAGPSGKNLEDAEIAFPIMTASDETQNIEPVVRYNGEVLTEEVDYILLGEVDYTKPGEYTCYIRGVREYCGLVECTYTVKEIGIAGWNLTLGDQVGVNFYVTVGSHLLNDAEISISIDGETEVYPLNQGVLDKNTDSYRFAVPIAAAQMTQPVTVELRVEEKVISSKTYTVRQYAEYILDDNNGYEDSVKALVKSLLNYGAASQNYFSYHTYNLANTGFETGAQNPIPYEITDINIDDQLSGCGYYGASLLFYGEITLRFYFKISGNPECYQVYNWHDMPPLHSKDGLYYVDITGICPQNLDEMIYLCVTSDNGYLSVDYSPMHYIARMYHREEAGNSMRELLQALYDYHLAAEEYLLSLKNIA